MNRKKVDFIAGIETISVFNSALLIKCNIQILISIKKTALNKVQAHSFTMQLEFLCYL